MGEPSSQTRPACRPLRASGRTPGSVAAPSSSQLLFWASKNRGDSSRAAPRAAGMLGFLGVSEPGPRLAALGVASGHRPSSALTRLAPVHTVGVAHQPRRMTLPARDWRWPRPPLWWWLDQGLAGGLVAGLPLAVFEIVAIGGGRSARIAAGIVTAGAALDPGYPLGSAIVTGRALHGHLSALFGAFFGLVVSSAEMSPSTAIVVGAGGLYGLAPRAGRPTPTDGRSARRRSFA